MTRVPLTWERQMCLQNERPKRARRALLQFSPGMLCCDANTRLSAEGPGAEVDTRGTRNAV